MISNVLDSLRWRWVWRKAKSAALRNLRAQCDAPCLSFVVGDKVRARKHRKVDNQGGRGIVVIADYWHPELHKLGHLVQFDSMPAPWFHPLFMAGAELEYDRDDTGDGTREQEGR